MRFAAAAFALCAVAASGAAFSASARIGACARPASLGVVRFPRGGNEHVVSLGNCTDRVTGKAVAWHPPRTFRSSTGHVAAVATTGLRTKRGSEAITVDGRTVYRVAERYGSPGPILLAGWSPDSRWILFSIDPDLEKQGIVDPARVTREALQNAVSVAGTAMTMGSLIVELPEEKPAAGGGGMPRRWPTRGRRCR